MFKEYMQRLTGFKGLGKIERGKVNHIAIALNIPEINMPEKDTEKCKEKIFEIIRTQAEKEIPIITINLAGAEKNTDCLNSIFAKLETDETIKANKVKVFILGKWYDLGGEVVNTIKRVIEETKDYDSYFLNLCLNYDGHEEIIDACRMITRKATMGKLQIEDITEEEIKDNLYSSYFIPPDIMLIYGDVKSSGGFLLWDSPKCEMRFLKKSFSEFSPKDLE
ncbi:undecaprenyl diphosphate synthase family protein [Candidatus Woesearchaeota archaeon]|nr:undecaprenyl diphosphate synthase family protein [Candidatus Woesearchaeota archaeon]